MKGYILFIIIFILIIIASFGVYEIASSIIKENSIRTATSFSLNVSDKNNNSVDYQFPNDFNKISCVYNLTGYCYETKDGIMLINVTYDIDKITVSSYLITK